jgi:hypothetical protein
MNVSELQIKTEKYCFYSWVSYDNQPFENGYHKFIDENVFVLDSKPYKNGFNILLEFSNEFQKTLFFDNECYGETTNFNGAMYRYKLQHNIN